MTRKYCRCGLPSVPGLITDVALCQYHCDARQWGNTWADHCHPQHAEARHVVATCEHCRTNKAWGES